MRQPSCLVILLLIACLISGCANQQPPSGGPVDTEPPVLLEAEPADRSIFFTAQRITLTFDEYVIVDDPATHVIVSPPLPEEPKFRLRRKSVIIDLPDSLQPNTTYTIAFGEAIKDFNTKKNSLKNLTYVFATGEILDSLQLSGGLTNAYDNEAVEDALVMLYRDLDDSVVYRQRPYYFSRTDQNGRFTLRNLAPGAYKCFALKDENLNYRFDQYTEQIAFAEDPIFADSGKTIDLLLFQEPVDQLRLLDAKPVAPGQVLFQYNNPVSTFRIDTEAYQEGDKAETSPSLDSITYWLSDIYAKEALFTVSANDRLHDTVEITFEEVEPADSNKFKVNFLGLNRFLDKRTRKTKARIADLYRPLEFLLTRPANSWRPERIQLLRDTSDQSIPIQPEFVDAVQRRVRIAYDWEPELRYTLALDAGAFTDQAGFQSRKLQYLFKVRAAEDYGTMTFKVAVDSSSQRKHVMELRASRGTRIATADFSKTGDVHFDRVLAGRYELRIFQDDDGDGQWTGGEYRSGRQPERVVYFNKDLTLRANWDMELEVRIP